ncbi:hypothetical protein SAMN02745123_03469 [Desulforamulus aeronauticus DSM 10349]|uniref:Uncharacterized protein n=1 Tax=Desulforamulus aeronauticus DSM 10349 TaxID=1121421 RepID=A0A1M6W4U5_9FIRM|nr:hypothetical protein SAMN02745123_03469 [Desulforamulus aeronauticus DSM 10349]
MQNKNKENLLKQRANDSLRFEVGQGIGFIDEGNKIGLTQPTTGADTLTKTDHGNDAAFNPEI